MGLQKEGAQGLLPLPAPYHSSGPAVAAGQAAQQADVANDSKSGAVPDVLIEKCSDKNLTESFPHSHITICDVGGSHDQFATNQMV